MSSPRSRSGGQIQLEHAEAVVQVFAESLVADVLLQVLIRGGDDAHVDADFFCRADRQERVAFQNPQQFRLAFERQLADFVEKQRAQVGLLEKAHVVAIGAGERTGFVAEELALDQFSRDRGAVDARPSGDRRAGWQRWMARATSSLPEPLSPRTSTQPGARATRLIFDFKVAH